MTRIAPALVAATLVACASQSALDGMRLPPDLDAKAVFWVDAHAKDHRGLDHLVTESLRRRGIDARSERPERFDYRVTYEDRWWWDMRMYLVDLRVDVRDAETERLVATARSYQTSLAAIGDRYADIVDAAVRVLVDGPSAGTPAN